MLPVQSALAIRFVLSDSFDANLSANYAEGSFPCPSLRRGRLEVNFLEEFRWFIESRLLIKIPNLSVVQRLVWLLYPEDKAWLKYRWRFWKREGPLYCVDCGKVLIWSDKSFEDDVCSSVHYPMLADPGDGYYCRSCALRMDEEAEDDLQQELDEYPELTAYEPDSEAT